MTRRPVKSSNVKAIGHEGNTLEVEFHNGAVYRYAGVTPKQAAQLMGADSIGSHLHEHFISQPKKHKVTRIAKGK